MAFHSAGGGSSATPLLLGSMGAPPRHRFLLRDRGSEPDKAAAGIRRADGRGAESRRSRRGGWDVKPAFRAGERGERRDGFPLRPSRVLSTSDRRTSPCSREGGTSGGAHGAPVSSHRATTGSGTSALASAAQHDLRLGRSPTPGRQGDPAALACETEHRGRDEHAVTIGSCGELRKSRRARWRPQGCIRCALPGVRAPPLWARRHVAPR